LQEYNKLQNDLLKNQNRFDFKINCFRLSKNYGKSFALFFGAKNADADVQYFLFTDANSIFEQNYFANCYKYLLNNEELFGGVLNYIDFKTLENLYWLGETRLKLLETYADLYAIGLFGSNIIIKKDLYFKYPYYTFCDFSLPLYYQSQQQKKISLKADLIVFEETAEKLTEIFRVKFRIVNRAILGLIKYLKLSKRYPILLFAQIYIHKLTRWCNIALLIFIILPLLFYFFEIFKIIIFIFLGIIIFFCFFFKKKMRLFLYAFIVSLAAISAIVYAVFNYQLNRWQPSKKI